MSVLFEIVFEATQAIDPTAFFPPSAYAYSQIGTNHFRADATPFAPAPVGIFDLRGMVEEADRLLTDPIDKDATGADNPRRVTDLAIERSLFFSGGSPSRAMFVVSPPLPGAPFGVTDQETPNDTPTLGDPANFDRFGGGQFTSTLVTTPGGVVTLPTGYRVRVGATGIGNFMQFWLIPTYECGCWAKWAGTQAGTGG